MFVRVASCLFHLHLKFTEWVSHEYGDAGICACRKCTSEHTSCQNARSYAALTCLVAAGCKCIKNAVCDMWLREETASWHRWERAKIQLITGNIGPPPAKKDCSDNKCEQQVWAKKQRLGGRGVFQRGKGAGQSGRQNKTQWGPNK